MISFQVNGLDVELGKDKIMNMYSMILLVYDFTQHIRDYLSMILPDKCSMSFLFINVLKSFQVDCPDGQLGKDKILDMYSMILPVGNAKLFVDQIFRIFDKVTFNLI